MVHLQLVPGRALACSPERDLAQMSQWLPERRISCPYCGEQIVIVIDTSAGSQSYVEDCQVCCQAMQVSVDIEDGLLQSVYVDR
jgi:transcription elongation factor Elf1